MWSKFKNFKSFFAFISKLLFSTYALLSSNGRVGINGLGVDRKQKVLTFVDDTTMTLRGRDSIDRTFEKLKLKISHG